MIILKPIVDRDLVRVTTMYGRPNTHEPDGHSAADTVPQPWQPVRIPDDDEDFVDGSRIGLRTATFAEFEPTTQPGARFAPLGNTLFCLGLVARATSLGLRHTPGNHDHDQGLSAPLRFQYGHP